MIYCTYNVAVAEDMQKILDRLEMKNYQIFNNVVGKTTGASPRFNTPVWPGYNNSLLIQSENSEKFIETVLEFNDSTEDINEKISLFCWEINSY
jgi:hypothetical protein